MTLPSVFVVLNEARRSEEAGFVSNEINAVELVTRQKA
jgi:hypothetical protein